MGNNNRLLAQEKFNRENTYKLIVKEIIKQACAK